MGGGDYILALKGNHGTLHKDVKLFLESEVIKTVSNNIDNCHEKIDAGHGRIELRKCIVSSKIDWLEEKALRKKAGWGNGTLEFILKQNF